MIAQEAIVEEIPGGCPALSREQIELAPLYAAAFPRRGRPARRPWAKQKPSRVDGPALQLSRHGKTATRLVFTTTCL